ncbi:MAG: DUF1998 domain-containing protein, partial [Methyloprofundus sp.]|nr:DUF1998 domain-containing protein [Methyloprofundus sp.]
RQALADILGINADELGYTVKPTVLADCAYPIATIVIYDNCSGGAGFASSAHYHFKDMFKVAKKEYLKCMCKSVCQNCLLGFDTRFHIDYLDRHLALNFLSDDFIHQLDLPNELKILGEKSKYTIETFWLEIRQAAAKGAMQLHIFLQGSSNDWELSASSFIENIHHWKTLYNDVVLVINSQEKDKLSELIKEDLWVLSRLGVKISLTDEQQTNLKNSGCLIAQVLSSHTIKTFACSDAEYAIPNQNWMNNSTTSLIYAEDYPVIVLKEFLQESDLKPPAAKGDIEVEILDQCNGLLDQYAQKFWQIIATEHMPLQNHFKAGDKLLSIHYSDRYLYSPWTVILITQLIAGLKNVMQTHWNHPIIYIESAPKASGDYQKKGLFADWLEDSLRLDVIESLFSALNEECKSRINSNCPHGRFMRLEWKSGKTTVIRFDQGIAYWSCASKPYWSDNSISAIEQSESLTELISQLKVKNYRDFPTQIFIKER